MKERFDRSQYGQSPSPGARGDGASAEVSSSIRVVSLSEIDPDPFNIRGKLTGIATLADSIERHGLLENLVVIEQPETADGKWLVLKAGSRRFAAMKLLVDSGRWPPDATCHVLIINSDGVWENAVENIQRAELTPWDLGRRLSELSSAGLSHREIGARLGHSNGWVSRYVAIAQGLHPETIEFLDKRGLHRLPRMGELHRVATIVTPDGQPDAKEQIRMLSMPVKRRTPKRLDADRVRAFGLRLNYLHTEMRVPHLFRPIIYSVIQYLEDGTRPNFKLLEAELLRTQERFLQPAREVEP